jgi:hypothetical protein
LKYFNLFQIHKFQEKITLMIGIEF